LISNKTFKHPYLLNRSSDLDNFCAQTFVSTSRSF
jgi:hypothetical protein